MKKISFLFNIIFLIILFFVFLNNPTIVKAQGFASCSYMGTQCITGSTFCDSGYLPPTNHYDFCSYFNGNQNACNNAKIDCVKFAIEEPKPPSSCGGLGEKCCGSIPPMSCTSPYVPSDEDSTLSCFCQEAPASKTTGTTKITGATKPETCGSDDVIKTAIGCIPTKPQDLIGKLLTWGISLAGGIAFLLMIWAGFQFITSTGNPEKLQEAQSILTSAIAGLLLIIFSVFLLRLIGIKILGIPGFK